MAETIQELYLKYVNQVGPTLESDRYFQYLYELISASDNVLHQTNRVLHKVVDEQWLSVIEDSLDAINSIIDKPRRFVTTEEEVVPVALAKKITADSVRHLSQNTQFIASDEGGDIQPTRVLNVSTAETFDLYENRFIYHLIQRLVTFIDKRTDVIFWSTNDEVNNVLSFHSAVDDAYETIEYKLEMTIKNKQSFVENDSDNMQTFMRIDRVRRMVMALKNSSFCDLMSGCATVRSPIQRTNLMMKDPDYRTCYKLWQFLESYNEVGYTIVEQDRALEFDEEYLIQLYTNFITGYSVFKSLLSDKRDLDDEALAKHHRTRKPKFLKKLQEEIVTDYDIPDVEIRRVIVEQVTQAQLDAEAALAEEQIKTADLQGQVADLGKQLQSLYSQLEAMGAQLGETQAKAQAAGDALAAAQAQIQALEKARVEDQKQLRAQAEAKLKELSEAAEERLRALASEAGARITAAERRAEAAETARQTDEAELAALRSQAETARADAERLEGELARSREEAQAALTAQAEAEALAAQAQAEIDEAETARQEAEALRTQAQEDARAQQAAREAAEAALAAAEKAAQETQREAKAMMAQAAEERAQAEVKAAEAALRAAQEAEARAKAEAKAEANKLGKYLVTRLRGKDPGQGQ